MASGSEQGGADTVQAGGAISPAWGEVGDGVRSSAPEQQALKGITENGGPRAVGPWVKGSLFSMSVMFFCIIMLVFSLC